MLVAEKQNIILKKLTNEYASEMARLGNNPNVFKSVSDSFPSPYTKEKAYEFIAMANSKKMGVIFAILWKGKYVGNIGLHFREGIERKSVEIGYFIGEEFWGNGIATIAIELMCRYGFENLDINRIFASVMEFNIASQKALEKCGFEKEGVFKQALYKSNKFHNEHRYALLKA